MLAFLIKWIFSLDHSAGNIGKNKANMADCIKKQAQKNKNSTWVEYSLSM